MCQPKEFVGLDLCFFCQEPKGVILDRRLRKSLPRQATYNHEPCEKCKEYMQQGVIFISVRDGESGDNPYRTGGWVVIREEAVRRIFQGDIVNQVIAKRVAFIEDANWDLIGLPRG